MNTLSHEERCAVVRCLVDGCSIRATTRITGVAKNTIQKLTRELGEAVQQYHDNVVHRVKSQRVQCDEVWCFCYAKEKNLPDEMRAAGCGLNVDLDGLGCRHETDDRLETRGTRRGDGPRLHA